MLTYDLRHGYRGPERRLGGSLTADRNTWLRRLHGTAEIGGLLPAVVAGVEQRSVSVLLADGEIATIDWDHGLSGARRYIDEDHRGPAPQTAADVLAVGDLIRVRRNAKSALELRAIPTLESALISLNADDGAILSLVGGFDFHQSKFNRITQAQRQPGSGFKPFIYTAALENGFTAATLVNDAPIVYQEAGMEDAWRPENDTGKFYGPTPLRKALYESRNVVSVRLLQQLGVETAIDYVQRFGFDKNAIPHNLSVALGSLSVAPLQMARAFAVFANDGYLINPYVLQRVTDRNGEVVYDAKPLQACFDCPNALANQSPAAAADPAPGAPSTTASAPTTASSPTVATSPITVPPPNPAPQVLDKRYAFIMDSMLRDVVTKGTGAAASSLGRSDMAGKTGTTSGPVDTWFTGYSGGVVTSTWAGFDQNKPMGKDEYGATVALPIWINFMRAALQGVPERHLRQPEGVVSLRIDPRTGLQASPDQPDAVFEYFTADHLPGEQGPGYNPELTTPSGSGVSEHDLF